MKIDAARILAELWMEHHGLRVWRFEFDRARSRFGCCHWGQRKITLSRALVELNDEAEVEDVILHEIAHALAPPGEWHGPLWRSIAVRIGARAERCYSGARVRQPARPWRATCPNCMNVSYGYRRATVSCGKCCPGVFHPKFLLRWERAA